MSALAANPSNSVLTPEYIAFTNAPILLTQFGSLFAVASVVVFARCYVRWFMIKSFGKDDWLMLLAYAFAAATFGTYVEQTKVGMGKHIAVIVMDQQKYSKFLRLRQVSSILASFGVALVKMSIAYFLLRLVVHRGYVYFLHGLNIFMALVTFACVGTLAIVKAEIQRVILSNPDPFVHDSFTLWRFIEFDVGIIAASLPALKPLFNWCLGAARSLTTRAQRNTGAPNSLGYRKQSERSDKGIVLNNYNSRSANTVRISSRPSNGNLWTVGPGKISDESILPLHNNLEKKPGGIVVTRGVHVG
ncbi:hypothetical protein N0V86_008374 [Didymella sp. IMI 355093]|nr:hypothetical protein N0V86_008374 [Didymella sp. IMI 355093]